MVCFDCGAELTADKRFCGNCGRQIKKRNRTGAPRESSRVPPQTFPVREGVVAWNAWKVAKKDKHAKSMVKLRIVSGIAVSMAMLVAGVVYSGQAGNEQVPTSVMIAGMIVALGALVFLGSWLPCSLACSENVYYKFPGSRDANGKHQCIHCGWRGVHKSTPYKTNDVVANCSKCSENLWVA